MNRPPDNDGISPDHGPSKEIVPAMKHCPICTQELLISEFGICHSRKDGRNLYCKSCVRDKVAQHRRGVKEYKSARRKHAAQEVGLSDLINSDNSAAAVYERQISRLAPVEKVRQAIRQGAQTQQEIAQHTKLGKDEIGDALATLLLWTREIRTQAKDHTRLYFLNETDTVEAKSNPKQPLPRKSDIPTSFSCLPGLMPGKKIEREPQRNGSWVAA